MVRSARFDDSRPTVIIAYTVKGNDLHTEGHPQNHSSLLTVEQYREMAGQMGENADAPWNRFNPSSAAGQLVATTAEGLRRETTPAAAPPVVPTDFGRTPQATRLPTVIHFDA